MALAGGAAALLAGYPALTAAQTPELPQPAAFAEAPMLTDMVTAGTLPALADRLPPKPLVIAPTESIGTYGGTWRTATVGGSDDAWMGKTVGYEHLVRWDPQWEAVIPNLAESWTIEGDGLKSTFKLREGLKWSDGEPFTTADLLFYTEDVYPIPEITPGAGNNPITGEAIDDYTFTYTFERPNGMFLQNLATPYGSDYTRYPKHYLQQFHQKYNTTNLDQLVTDAGVENWSALFQSKGSADSYYQNSALPRLTAWMMAADYTGTQAQIKFTRNPYYWKVDTDGNQLPYIDNVNFEVLQDNEVLILKILNGEIDFHLRHINTDANKAVLADGAEKGGYRLFATQPSLMNKSMIAFNLCHKNLAYREIFTNKDFRIAMSHAINRQEIIDTVYVSQGEPWQASPRPESPFANDTLAKQYTEYNVDLANQMLDVILPNKGGDGFRTLPDGSSFIISVEVANAGVSSPVDDMTLACTYFQEVGINAQIKVEDRSLYYERKGANEHDCIVWHGDGGMQDGLIDSFWYAPMNVEANYAVPWAVWYEKPALPGTEPQEPPEAVKAQLDLYTQFQATADADKQADLFNQILQIAIEQFYVVGVNLPGPGYGIARANVKNILEPMWDAYLYPAPGPTNPEQFYFA
jgi:peptide/nickel transport system substrate-binding protein